MACQQQRPDYPSGATPSQIACADACWATYVAACAACNGDFTCQQFRWNEFVNAWANCFAGAEPSGSGSGGDN